jgi:hypothetical protein
MWEFGETVTALVWKASFSKERHSFVPHPLTGENHSKVLSQEKDYCLSRTTLELENKEQACLRELRNALSQGLGERRWLGTWTHRGVQVVERTLIVRCAVVKSPILPGKKKVHCLRVTVETEHQACDWCVLSHWNLPSLYMCWLLGGSKTLSPGLANHMISIASPPLQGGELLGRDLKALRSASENWHVFAESRIESHLNHMISVATKPREDCQERSKSTETRHNTSVPWFCPCQCRTKCSVCSP